MTGIGYQGLFQRAGAGGSTSWIPKHNNATPRTSHTRAFYKRHVGCNPQNFSTAFISRVNKKIGKYIFIFLK
jgi:hypothetical protein